MVYLCSFNVLARIFKGFDYIITWFLDKILELFQIIKLDLGAN